MELGVVSHGCFLLLTLGYAISLFLSLSLSLSLSLQLPADSPSHPHPSHHHERSKDRPKTPLTPGGSKKKVFMESMLAPPTLSQDQFYSKEKASELFVKGHSDIGVTVSGERERKGERESLVKAL